MNIPIRKVNFMDSHLDGILWYIRKMTPGKKTALDFGGIDFLRPECVILMIIVSKMIFDKTEQSVAWINLSPDEKSYLERINISQIEFIDVPSPERLWFRSRTPSKYLFELQRINDISQLEDAMIRTKEILKQWFPNDIRGNSFYNDAAVMIMEIVNNSIEHSVSNFEVNPGICYFTIQKYQPKTTNHPKVVIAFGDAGMGIRSSLQRVYEWVPNNDLYAIKKVLLEGGVTSRTNGMGGLGLRSIVELLEKNGGYITVRSGFNSVFYAPKVKQMESRRFREAAIGTQTSIVL